MNKQQIIWLTAFVISLAVALVLHLVWGDGELASFIKGFFAGLSVGMLIRFIMECRKKRS